MVHPIREESYPEHDKLRAVKEQSQHQGAFIEWLRDAGYIVCLYNDVGGITKPFLYRRNTEPKNSRIKITEEDVKLFKEQGLLTTKQCEVDTENHSPVMVYKIYDTGWLASEILDMQLGSRMDRYAKRHPKKGKKGKGKG